jgi:hypothetical protein
MAPPAARCLQYSSPRAWPIHTSGTHTVTNKQSAPCSLAQKPGHGQSHSCGKLSWCRAPTNQREFSTGNVPNGDVLSGDTGDVTASNATEKTRRDGCTDMTRLAALGGGARS